MSFPSAITKLEEGASPKEALMYAFEHDTPLGFSAVTALARAVKTAASDPVALVKKALGANEKDALRVEKRGKGIVMDFDPLSKTGLQIARLIGTDAARPLMTAHIGLAVGYGNCCKLILSPDEKDTRFTAEEQIRWQTAIDC